MKRDVSVIIPAFRCAAMIARAVHSALEQDRACEVIVVDDASGDDTAASARRAGQGDERLMVLEQPVNQGPSAARNVAIQASGGDWIALLDADDFMAPGRLATLVDRAEARGWDFIADDLIRLPEGAQTRNGRRHWRDAPIGEIELDLARFVLENDFENCGPGRELGYLKPVMRRDFLIRHDLSYDEGMRLGEDFDLYARALAAGARFGLVDPAGYYAIDRPGSLSKHHSGADLQGVWRSARALLADPGLDEAARQALRAHVRLSHKKWAWVRQIEAVRARDPGAFLAAFAAPPDVVVHLIGKLAGHFSRREGRQA